jgi:polysaccharide chain length determinant protein (PEP-CTERM system associated)
MATAEVQHEQGLNLGDVSAIIRRRRWWFAIPTALGLVGSVILAFTLPAEYEAEATVVNESQAIPDELAKTTVTSTAESRWNNLRLEILARDNLLAVISDFTLYREERVPDEEKVARLRERITIEPLPPAIVDPRDPVKLDAFRIAFRWPDRQESAAVANRLTRDFIAANLKDRASTAEGASEFITQELTKARSQLSDVAQQITDYKENFQGELPEQLALNRERLERARTSLADNESKLEEAREQVSYLRRQMEQMRRASTSSDENPVIMKERLELQLNMYLSGGKTEKHPDVARTRAEIAGLEDAIKGIDKDPDAVTRDQIFLLKELRDYEIDAQVYASEIERYKADLAEYEQRIENTPRRAAELDHLETTYENLNDAIRILQLKKVEADMGRNIELANKGERFSIVESAKEPEHPVSPNRPLILIAGIALGLLTGLGLLVLREASDTSFHSVADLQRTLGIPVLAAVPRIELAADRARRLRLLRRLVGAGAVVLLFATAAAVAWHYLGGEGDPLTAASSERSADV